MQIIDVKNPNALLVPGVQALLERALSSTNILAPGGLNSVAEDLYRIVTREDHFLLLGLEDGEWKAMMLGFLPSSRLFPYPMVQMMYNEGSRALKQAIGDYLMDIFLKAGYTKAWAINGSERPDGAWLRALVNKDKIEARRIGSVFELGAK